MSKYGKDAEATSAKVGDGMSSPREARSAYLATLPAEEAVRIMQLAEQHGPGVDSPEWLIAYAAAKMEVVVAELERKTVETTTKGAVVVSASPARDRSMCGYCLAFSLAFLCFCAVEALYARLPHAIALAITYAIGAVAGGIATVVVALRR